MLLSSVMLLCVNSTGMSIGLQLTVKGGSETEDVGEADFLEVLLCYVQGLNLILKKMNGEPMRNFKKIYNNNEMCIQMSY